ncbi:MAG: phage tail assembly protein [Synechococcales bacterium]|nr:phage tail assembly protein [Synechococcales bacterium]
MLSTQFNFQLPRGLMDETGQVHRRGIMRLATAKDELLVQRDRRVRENSAYATLMMLSQVITHLGTLELVTPEQLENLFTQDLGYLREFYNRINQQGNAKVASQCPNCNTQFEVELVLAGECLATP